MKLRTLFFLGICFYLLSCANEGSSSDEWNKVVDGVHVRTGMYDDPNLQVVIGACTPCHSAQLVTQNRATREGWEGMIRWMQATQNLTDLGESEPVILDYLAKYYAPEETGRRKNLVLAEGDWYQL